MLSSPAVDVRTAPPVVTVPAPREVDLASEAAFRAQLAAAVAAAAPGARVVVDFGDVEFCDSTAIGVLLEARGAAAATGGVLEVARPHRLLRRIADLLGVPELLDLP